MLFPINLGLKLSRPLTGICQKLRKYFPGLAKELESAKLELSDYTYLSLVIINLLFYFILFVGLLFTLLYVVQAKPFLYSIRQSVLNTALIVVLVGYGLFTYPKVLAGKKAEEIDKNLVFALRDLLMQVSSGVPLYNGLVNISKAGYGQISQEIELVAKSINTGTPVDKALQIMAIHTKSPYLKRVTWQLINTIKAGSSLKNALRIVVADLTLEQKSKIRDYAHELNLWSLIYMLFAVAVPTIGIVMMVILSSFMGMGLGQSMFIAFIIICLVVQYVIISLIKSRRPVVEF
jgi:flagellar protein FlaJ